MLRAGEDVEPDLLAEVSTLGSGSRAIGVYQQRWAEPGGRPQRSTCTRVDDPGNVGTIIRSAHALGDGAGDPGPGMRRPLLAEGRAGEHGLDLRAPAGTGRRSGELRAACVALDARGADRRSRRPSSRRRVVLCLGAEREGLPAELAAGGAVPHPAGRTDSLNVAMAATVALYELAHRMAADA